MFFFCILSVRTEEEEECWFSFKDEYPVTTTHIHLILRMLTKLLKSFKFESFRETFPYILNIALSPAVFRCDTHKLTQIEIHGSKKVNYTRNDE